VWLEESYGLEGKRKRLLPRLRQPQHALLQETTRLARQALLVQQEAEEAESERVD
jgi:hypothetical protein